jgi:hypothetical protein
VRVVGGRRDHLVEVVVAHACDLIERQHDVAGDVVGAAHLLRREERRVRFHEDAVERGGRDRLAQMFVLGVGHVAGEADPVTTFDARACDRSVAREAVDHDPVGRTLIEDSKDIRPRVADVDDHRLAGLVRQRDVGPEDPDLILGWRTHPEVVEPTLPHADHAGVVHELLDPGARLRVEGGGVVGMHPGRREHTLDGIGELGRVGARGHVDADADQPTHPSTPRGLDHICRFAVEQEQVAVGVNGPGISPRFRVLVAHARRAYKGLHIRSMGGASRET